MHRQCLMKAALVFSYLFVFSLLVPAADQCKVILLQTHPGITFSLDVEKGEAKNLLELASLDVGTNKKVDQLREILLAVKAQRSFEKTAPELLFLKSFRKETSILRNAFLIFTADHFVPKKFSAFVRELGLLNDLIAIENKDALKTQAELVLSLLRKVDFKALKVDLNYGSRKDVHSYFKNRRKHLASLLKKRTISIEEFHEIRKLLKEYLTYFQLKNLRTTAGEKRPEEKFFFDLNEELGLVNDQYTSQLLRGEIHPSDKVSLSQASYQKINLLLQSPQ